MGARRMSARRRKSGRGVVGWAWRLLLLALVWLVGVAAYIIWVGQRDDAAPADAIIVLGAAAYDAKPSPVFEERIRHGIDLYKRGLAPTLIFTGGYGGVGARFSESQVARRYALRQGVPEKAILIESLSRNTHDNLRQARTLMQQHQLHSVIIVSDPLHMARALRISRDLGIRSVGSPTPTSRFRSFATRWRFLLQEVYFFHRDRLPR
ncbi:protein sanA-like protein [Pseudoxanthomonas sp. Root65]|nr:protein sanA-like protein [Pseudoxanthomonas sp. Root65]